MHDVATRGMTPAQNDRITVDEIMKRQAEGEQFVFVDTRNPKAWGEADTKVPGAVRIPLDNAAEEIPNLEREKPIITYCT